MQWKPVLLVALVVGAAIGAILTLSSREPGYDPGSPDRGPGGAPGGEPGSDGDGPPPGTEPRPPARVADLFTDRTKRAGRELASRLADPKEAKKIALEVGALGTPEERARAFLRLLRTEEDPAGEFVRAAAVGAHGDELRVPAILALAGGGEAEIALLDEITRAWEEPRLATTAVLALHLAGTAEAQTSLAALVESSSDAARRIAIYDALGGGIEGMALGSDFVGDLKGGPGGFELRPDARFPAPYGRMVTAIASEREPGAMPAAVRVLARLPGSDARDAILEVWGRADGELREQVFVAVVGDLRPGEGATIARMAGSLTGPETMELRRQAMEIVRNGNGPGLSEAIRDWMEREEDPVIREELTEAVRRIDDLDPEEIR